MLYMSIPWTYASSEHNLVKRPVRSPRRGFRPAGNLPWLRAPASRSSRALICAVCPWAGRVQDPLPSHDSYRNSASAPDQVSVCVFVLPAALGAGGGPRPPTRITPSNARLMASGRVGFGSGRVAIQASRRASWSGGETVSSLGGLPGADRGRRPGGAQGRRVVQARDDLSPLFSPHLSDGLDRASDSGRKHRDSRVADYSPGLLQKRRSAALLKPGSACYTDAGRDLTPPPASRGRNDDDTDRCPCA
jgi:hypothetical protein